MSAIGLEMSVDTDLAAVAVAVAGDRDCCQVELSYYGPAEGAVAEVARLAAGAAGGLGCGTFCDPMPCAGLLPGLRGAGVQPHLLEAVDVAAAAYEWKAEVRARRVTAGPHEALKAAMQYAVRRPLATAFAFERRKVEADMSPLNACAFAVWGLRRGQGAFFAGWR
jgi:hypothetical protein